MRDGLNLCAGLAVWEREGDFGAIPNKRDSYLVDCQYADSKDGCTYSNLGVNHEEDFVYCDISCHPFLDLCER